MTTRYAHDAEYKNNRQNLTETEEQQAATEMYVASAEVCTEELFITQTKTEKQYFNHRTMRAQSVE